eukprot:6524266-Ditylum_brightwellii.AAC.1
MTDADVNVFRVNPPPHLSLSTTLAIFPSLKAYITVNGCTVTGKLQQWLCKSYTSSNIYDHIQTKTFLTIDKMNMIDWDNLGCVLEHQHLHTKIRLVKCIHYWLNTGYQQKKIDENAANECPVCLTMEETWAHLFQYQHANAIAIRMLAITTFKLGVQSAVEDQHWIGWNNFMKGWISIKWKATQKMYTDALPASTNSKEFNKNLWSSRVITEIWSIF